VFVGSALRHSVMMQGPFVPHQHFEIVVLLLSAFEGNVTDRSCSEAQKPDAESSSRQARQPSGQPIGLQGE
jgi:hypothetical protein